MFLKKPPVKSDQRPFQSTMSLGVNTSMTYVTALDPVSADTICSLSLNSNCFIWELGLFLTLKKLHTNESQQLCVKV